jgi:4,5-dihydroxyphthalate decarboxylase
VAIDGVDLTCLLYPVEEIFFRFTKFREWEISEMSLGKFAALKSRGDDSIVGIPVFPSRSFRHSGIFIRADGPVDRPEELAGARIGIPEWSVTATVYQRGILQHDYGVDLERVTWVQAGINAKGRIETLPPNLPEGVSIEQRVDSTLNELLINGEIDAMLVPHPPEAFDDRSGRIVQLFSRTREVEMEYFQRSGVFPIMHLVVARRDVVDDYPWLPMNLCKAFETAKDRSLARLYDATAPHFPLPWGPERAREDESVFGRDLWPYGIEANRRTLEAFLGFASEQALVDPGLRVDDLFPEVVKEQFRI